MSALRRDCGRWCVGLRCASRELPDPSTKLLVAKGLWWVQETLRCRVYDSQKGNCRQSIYMEGKSRAEVVSIPRLTLAFPASTGCLVNVWDTMILYIGDHLV